MHISSLQHANIISLLGIESLPIAKRLGIVEEALELVDARVLNRALDMLAEEDRAEFAQLLEKEDLNSAQQFLLERNIDMFSLVGEEVEKVKHELLDLGKERDW